MAIRQLIDKDRDLPTLGAPTAIALTDKQVEDLARTMGGERDMEHKLAYAATNHFVETWAGCVLQLGEHNHYDDSDFYAIVWDAAEGKPREVEYATTRGWTYWNNASVDATSEVLAAYAAYKAKRAAEARERREAWEAVQPYAGRTVKVIKTCRSKGVKIPVGTVAEVKWYGEDKLNRNQLLDPKYRIGIDLDDKRVFLAADNVELVTDEVITLDEARQAIEAATDPKRLANARRASVLATIDNLRDALISAGGNARTEVSRLALVHAATELGSAREYLARGVNGNANIHLDRAHKTLTPLRTRASLAATREIKALGLL